MAKINATDILVFVNDVAVAHQTNGSLSIAQDLPDASSKDSGGWAEHINGQRSWSISVEGLVDYSASFGVEQLANLILNRTSATIRFGTGTTGDLRFEGTANLGDLSQDAGLETPLTFSGELTGTGALVMTTEA